MRPTTLSWADVSKWGSILALVCGAVYQLSQKQFNEAYALICAAMAAAGLGAKLNTAVQVSHHNAACLRQIQAEVGEVKTVVQVPGPTADPVNLPKDCF